MGFAPSARWWPRVQRWRCAATVSPQSPSMESLVRRTLRSLRRGGAALCAALLTFSISAATPHRPAEGAGGGGEMTARLQSVRQQLADLHLAALDRLGPTPEHRRSFAPVREALKKNDAVS